MMVGGSTPGWSKLGVITSVSLDCGLCAHSTAYLLRQFRTHFQFSGVSLSFFPSLERPPVAEVAEPRSRVSRFFRDILSHRLLKYISCRDSSGSIPHPFAPFCVSGFPSYRPPISEVYGPMSPSILPGACFVVFGHCSCHQDRGLECWGHRGVRSPVPMLRMSSQLFCYRPLQHIPRTRSPALKPPYEMGLKALRAVFNHPPW
jgi:hypothetical protein